MQDEVQQQIEQVVKSNSLVIFMKGTPQAPQCGFSAATVNVFDSLGVEYAAVDVLADFGVREGVKQYTNWPTIPQVFVNGEFIGGCDICQEMYLSGELAKMVEGVAKRA